MRINFLLSSSVSFFSLSFKELQSQKKVVLLHRVFWFVLRNRNQICCEYSRWCDLVAKRMLTQFPLMGPHPEIHSWFRLEFTFCKEKTVATDTENILPFQQRATLQTDHCEAQQKGSFLSFDFRNEHFCRREVSVTRGIQLQNKGAKHWIC